MSRDGTTITKATKSDLDVDVDVNCYSLFEQLKNPANFTIARLRKIGLLCLFVCHTLKMGGGDGDNL